MPHPKLREMNYYFKLTDVITGSAIGRKQWSRKGPQPAEAEIKRGYGEKYDVKFCTEAEFKTLSKKSKT